MPRAGLTGLRVVEEAETVADEVGLAQLTLAALAGRLGVRQPSLYKHVEGIDALQRSIALRAKTELAAVLGRAATGRSGTAALRSMADAYRSWAGAHPGRYAALQRPSAPDDPEMAAADRAAVDVVLAVLAGYGLDGDDAIDATRALRAALHGFAVLDAAGDFALPVDVDRSYHRLVDGLDRALRTWPGAAEPA